MTDCPAAKRAKTFQAATSAAADEDKIAVVDFGGQYAHLIALKVRAASVKAEILQPDDPLEKFTGYTGIILSGSPSLSAHGEGAEWTKEVLDLQVPILGFCFGHQEIAKRYGGTVTHADNCEFGHTTLNIMRTHEIFHGLEPKQVVWMSHYDTVQTVGPDFEELGYTMTSLRATDGAEVVDKRGPNAAICCDKLRRYGFQFHPEVDTTEHGAEMISNFVLRICGCRPTWDMQTYRMKSIADVAAKVGERGVFLLASGGVDSTVCAVLFSKCMAPSKLKLLHIDNGLMRKDESHRVVESFKELGLKESLIFIDASEEFLSALDGVTAPEQKRVIIGNTFIEIFEREARKLGIEGHLLGQGTIYPDTIESGGTRRADVIKTHHNRVALVQEMIEAGAVIEPLKELYKVEVRALARELGVSAELIGRHPFPGPGLGVRLLCSAGGTATPPNDALVAVLGAHEGFTGSVLPVRSVGVKADLRSYENAAMVSCSNENVGWDELIDLARIVLRDVPGVNRVIWNLKPGAPPSTFEDLKAHTTRARLDLLREADWQLMQGLRRHGLYDTIWQCAAVAVPLRIDGEGSELIIARPVLTDRAMTARPAPLPKALREELRRGILALPGISGLALDLTSKPPATIEWE
eukprot:NODE_35_length_2566_cov_425.397053.p1 GENE.NODE_35_length_2566_cov_425.397053~~NODE_35_length_2566_cov_425.397053.p1  ORF type:complete len:637 (-),score=201.27 NODE_35_length_2566_cov_425.397053:554-2464(-)